MKIGSLGWDEILDWGVPEGLPPVMSVQRVATALRCSLLPLLARTVAGLWAARVPVSACVCVSSFPTEPFPFPFSSPSFALLPLLLLLLLLLLPTYHRFLGLSLSPLLFLYILPSLLTYI